jgi:hypothetical protein
MCELQGFRPKIDKQECGPVLADENAVPDVGDREERDRVAARLVEQEHVLAVGDPLVGQLDSEPSAKGLDEQQSFWERLRSEEAAHRRAAQWALLPGQSRRFPSDRADQPRSHATTLSDPPPTAS